MFEEVVKQVSEQGDDQQFTRWCKAVDGIATDGPERIPALRRVANALWQGFTGAQRAKGHDYLVVMGYLGEAGAILRELGGQVIEF